MHAALRRAAPGGVVELVPAARTLLVRIDPARCDVAGLGELVGELSEVEPEAAPRGEVVVPVRYDGADLDEVAGLAGLSADEVIARHSAGRYTVAFCGFAPGFGYLTGLDPVLHLPRRDSPRTQVPAGSVAIAGEYGGIYPTASPGGWRLLGRTGLRTWDLTRRPPALLMPGVAVRFEPA